MAASSGYRDFAGEIAFGTGKRLNIAVTKADGTPQDLTTSPWSLSLTARVGGPAGPLLFTLTSASGISIAGDTSGTATAVITPALLAALGPMGAPIPAVLFLFLTGTDAAALVHELAAGTIVVKSGP